MVFQLLYLFLIKFIAMTLSSSVNAAFKDKHSGTNTQLLKNVWKHKQKP